MTNPLSRPASRRNSPAPSLPVFFAAFAAFELFAAFLLVVGKPAHSAPPPTPLARIHARGELTWAGDLQGGEPYVFRDPRNPDHLVGFEVEIAEALATALGVHARFVQNDWHNLVPSLERGDFDIALNGLEDTRELRDRVLVTEPYAGFREQLVVRKGSKFRSLPSLHGQRVGTLSESLAQQILRKSGVEVVLYEGQDEPYSDLVEERLQGVLLDSVIASRYGLTKKTLELADGDVARATYVIAVRKSEGELRDALNHAFDGLRSSGKLAAILNRWKIEDASIATAHSLVQDSSGAMVSPAQASPAPANASSDAGSFSLVFKPSPTTPDGAVSGSQGAATDSASATGALTNSGANGASATAGASGASAAADANGSNDASPDDIPAAQFDRAQLFLFARGAGITLLVTFLAMALAAPLGLLLALMRIYGAAPLRYLSNAYVELLRGTPVLLQLYLLYYGLAPIVHLNALSAAVLGLGMNYGAYEAEVHRAALGAVAIGQGEAAAALGMSRAQALRLVLLPQSLRTALPAMTNDLIALLKDSSLISVITVVELTKQMTITAVDVRSWALPGMICAGFYFAMSWPLGRLAMALEDRLARSGEEVVR